MEFDFEVAHRSGAHHKAFGSLSHLTRVSLGDGEGSEGDIDHHISTYCILGQVLEAETIPKKEEQTSLDAITTAELCDAQQMDAFCKYTSKHFGTVTALQLMSKD